ncbi:tRNA lysidine(34) synthetase TilS [Pseudomonas typographi]|uniref:tRNA(Ile)-lysidine synthase n=1 Tax=Pseudomonas typographi TaxID=2715964 RepID=A0ABR7YXX5_9PSED|nr:tRNA lysidine(34) synthetase TilS [Pseudomonas typographi]MBD1598042.1 tRNA lysidine(34) synthetase TilS [Pseudomonas typographi]
MNLPDHLLKTLAGWLSAPRWTIALSGGLDSTVLLHLLAALAKEHGLPPLRAIHVHHGLQPAADAWPGHCQRVCDAYGVPLEVLKVEVPAHASPEQAARRARHCALAQRLEPGEVLLLAHHRDDQAETVLYRLLRGAGVHGLAAMPACRRAGAGWLVRPLLAVGRATLQAYASNQRLHWVEDPSNARSEADRNYLRHQVLPALQARWPHAPASLARAAGHCAEAQALLGDLAAADLAQPPAALPWLPLPSLALAPLLGLSPARQRNALRHFLAPLTRLPDTEHWHGWDNLRDARLAGEPCWRLADGELRRAGGRLWWLSGAWLQLWPTQPVPWPQPGTPLQLPGNGHVWLQAPVPGQLHIGYRQGGERLRIPGRGQRDLKRWMQEQGVPVFLRGRLPLLFAGGELLAVAQFPLAAGENPPLCWAVPTNEQRLR